VEKPSYYERNKVRKMILMFLLGIVILLAVFAVLMVLLTISKCINGFFFDIFGGAFVVVKLLCWLKKLIVVGLIIKLYQKSKKAD